VGQDMTPHWIELTYFKQNGTYYSSGEFYFPPGVAREMIIAAVQEWVDKKTLPGLTKGASGYHVFIHEGPEGHPMSGCPHLITTNPVDKEDCTVEPVH
jgi:hypothetical protein